MEGGQQPIERLLFAMLVVDLEFATAEEIASAPGVAEAQSANELGGCLVKAGVLNADDRKIVEQAVARTISSAVSTMAEPAASTRRSQRQEKAAAQEGLRTVTEAHERQQAQFDSEEEKLAEERDGRYDLRGVHGRGGQARVMLAWDMEMEREVAFKVIREPGEPGSQSLPAPGSSKRSTPGSIRFLREARVTGQLEHPNIVPVYEVGRRKSGQLYYTMRLVRGRTLSNALTDCTSLPQRLERLGAFWDTCKAIAFAHSRGVIHRDLKPENVMVGEFGETVLLDWGVAKVRGQHDIRARDLQKELEKLQRASSSETAAGTAVGTPSYMSPEQARGQVEEIDNRSDVWGLGAVLYEILTGCPPFMGPSPLATLQSVVHDPLIPVRERCQEAPRELSAIAEKCLNKDKAQRYQNAKAVADDVQAYMTGSKVQAYEYSSLELARRFAAKNKPALILATTALLVILGALVSVSLSLGRERQAREREAVALAQEEAARQQEHRERLMANFHLAQAYSERADRLAAEQSYLSSAVFAAASLLHNPAHPKSPFFAEGFAQENPGSAQTRVIAASQTYRARFGALASLSRSLRGTESFEEAAYSPDGRLVAGADNKVVRLWSTATGEQVRALTGHGDRVFGVAFSPDGKLLATSSRDRTIILWDPATGEKIRTLSGHTDTVSSVRFSPDGSMLASSSWDHGARLWDVRTGAQKFLLAGHGDRVNRVAFSPDGKLLATCSHDATVRLWSTGSGKSERIFKLSGTIGAVAFSPDGASLATGCLEKRICTFEVKTGKEELELQGHKDSATDLAYSPDGRLLFSVSFDKTARLWDARTGRALLSLEDHDDFVQGLSVSPDGKQLATSSYDRSVKLWDLRPQGGIPTLSGHTDAIYCLAYSPDGKLLASAGWDKIVRVWDVAGLKKVASLEGHTDAIDGGLAFLDDQHLASAAKDHLIRVWDLTTGKQVAVGKGHTLAIYGLSISPDRKVLVSAGFDKTLRFWDAATLQQTRIVEGATEPIDRTIFSPDGKLLATAGYDKTVKLWNPATGEVIRSMSGHADWVSGVYFSPDGKQLASSGKDGVAIVWDVATGKELRRLEGHSQWVNDVRFSHDGKLIATTSDDTTVRVWSAATGETLLILKMSREAVAAEFSPDDKTLAVGDGVDVRLYPLDFSALDADPKLLLGEAERQAGERLDGSQLKSTQSEAPAPK